MHITHLIASLEGGGAEKQALYQLIESKKRDINISLIALSLSEHSKYKLNEFNINYHIVGKSIPVAFFKILMILHRNRPNIVSTWLAHMDLIGGIASKLLRIKWILNERSSAQAYSSKTNQGAINPLLLLLRNFLGKYSDIIIANSLPGKSYWEDFQLHQNVNFIPNIIYLNESNDLKKSPLEEPLKQPCILNVGSLIESKNCISLINAIAIINKTRNLYLYVIGEGPLELPLKEHVKSLGLEEKIVFLGKINDWLPLLYQSEALVHPSLYEGMPNVVLEAINLKCPVLISKIDAHRSILDPHQALFFDPLDDKDLSDKILELLLNKEESSERSEIAYNSLKKYHPDEILKSLSKVYKKIY